MKYSLYIAATADDKRAAYSYVLVNYTGIIAKGTYLTVGERRFDDSFCGHVALQRSLREAARQDGVLDVTVVLDAGGLQEIGLELMDVSPPLYPALWRNTKRVMQRFSECTLAAMKKNDEMTREEASVFDECLDALEQSRTFGGRLRLIRDCLLGKNNIIR
ncbi:hypothetical protein HGO21_29370 [Acinetobacter sp. CUI P1]|nr:hypothetical protein [Acinetobacter sp. CUI P1]